MTYRIDGPTELANAILKDWPGIEGFPSAKNVKTIVMELFRLSLTVDEGRYPQLLFVWPGVGPEDHTYVPLGARPRYLADIVSLAPGIAPPPFALVIRGAPELCRGILRLDVGRTPSPGVYFGIRGPGEVEVTVSHRGDMESWILSRGRCRKVRALKDCAALAGLCRQVAKVTGSGSTLVFELLQQIIYSVAARLHGGALLFSNDEPKSMTVPTIDFGTQPFPLLPPVKRDLAALSETARVVSCLSQLDGAMLFDASLRLRGAGVFLDHLETEVWPAEGPYAGQATEITLLGLGSRHRSAAAFCADHEGSVAVVISQDRDIRVFNREGSKVILDGPFQDLMLFAAGDLNNSPSMVTKRLEAEHRPFAQSLARRNLTDRKENPMTDHPETTTEATDDSLSRNLLLEETDSEGGGQPEPDSGGGPKAGRKAKRPGAKE